jgi:hypothetical protein
MNWDNVQLPLFDPVRDLGNTTFDVNGPTYRSTASSCSWWHGSRTD